MASETCCRCAQQVQDKEPADEPLLCEHCRQEERIAALERRLLDLENLVLQRMGYTMLVRRQ